MQRAGSVFPANRLGAREGFGPGRSWGWATTNSVMPTTATGASCGTAGAATGRAWEAGDVVGCYIDLDEGIILFTVNGHLVEFDDDDEDGARPAFDGVGKWKVVPRVTLKSGTCRVNFGERDLDHPEASTARPSPVALAAALHEPPRRTKASRFSDDLQLDDHYGAGLISRLRLRLVTSRRGVMD